MSWDDLLKALCPDHESLWAYASGRLEAADVRPARDAIADHVRECRECAALVELGREAARDDDRIRWGEGTNVPQGLLGELGPGRARDASGMIGGAWSSGRILPLDGRRWRERWASSIACWWSSTALVGWWWKYSRGESFAWLGFSLVTRWLPFLVFYRDHYRWRLWPVQVGLWGRYTLGFERRGWGSTAELRRRNAERGKGGSGL